MMDQPQMELNAAINLQKPVCYPPIPKTLLATTSWGKDHSQNILTKEPQQYNQQMSSYSYGHSSDSLLSDNLPSRSQEIVPPHETITNPVLDQQQLIEDIPKGVTSKNQKRKNFRRQVLRSRKDPFRAKIFRRTLKKRRNAYLKRLLKPKNALSILQEFHPNLSISLSEQLIKNQMHFYSKIEIEGNIYNGVGDSAEIAKEAGSEIALKAIILEKLKHLDEVSKSDKTKKEIEDPSVSELSDADEGGKINEAIAEGNENDCDTNVNEEQDDNASWSCLASYAIHKLFAEWKAQGLTEPATSEFIIRSKVGHIAKSEALPKKHPVQLLHEIKPNCQFVESRHGTPPNLLFTFSVTADERTYTGTGRSKKLAKKECAKNALDALGVNYICL